MIREQLNGLAAGEAQDVVWAEIMHRNLIRVDAQDSCLDRAVVARPLESCGSRLAGLVNLHAVKLIFETLETGSWWYQAGVIRA